MTRVLTAPSGATLEYGEFEPATPARGVVVICPGGGYELVSPRESRPVAARFAAAGWRPFVLTYTVGRDLGLAPLRDAAWAVAEARRLGAEKEDGNGLVALCGFSAGGHLAASLGVHWDDADVFPDAEARRWSRPDALVLCYPVVSAGPYRHEGSFARLGGGAGMAGYFSIERHVDARTPPAFIWHTAADESVPVENSLLLAEALRAAAVPFELHVYPHGPHGLSLATPEVEDADKGRLADPHVAGWFDLCLDWLELQRKRSEP